MVLTRKLFSSRVGLLAALFVAILGGKFLLIERYGSEVPYWDQWDAEGDNLIRPYLEGRLAVAQFFAAHNEHRILFTRLQALGLFAANGRQWDARLEIVANAALHAGFAVLLAGFALEILPGLPGWLYAGLIAWCCTAPSTWENVLGGFQSQFYFLLLFSALHLGGSLAARPRSRFWWWAPLAGVAAIFSMASGAISAATILIVLGLRFVRDRRLAGPDIGLLGINLGLLALGALVRVPAMPGSEAAGMRVTDIGAWIAACRHELSWPTGQGWTVPLNLLPPVALAWVWLRRRLEARWAPLLLGACCWSGLQIAALAYARGGFEHGYSSRYTDLLGTGWLVNLLALGALAGRPGSLAPRRAWLAAVALFCGAGLVGLWQQNAQNQQGFLERMPRLNQARLDAVRSYVATQDPALLQRMPKYALPYPDVARLTLLLDVPALRSSLPASIAPGPVQPRALSRLAERAVHLGGWLLALAAGLAATSACFRFLRFTPLCPPPPNP